MLQNRRAWVFFVLFLLCLVVPSLASEVYLGALPGWVINLESGGVIPIFVKYDAGTSEMCLWREEGGRKVFCSPEKAKLVGEALFFECEWVGDETCIPLSGSGYLNAFLKLDGGSSEKIYLCLRGKEGKVCSHYGASGNGTSSYPWVFVGYQEVEGSGTLNATMGSVYVPVFLKTSGFGGRFLVWAEGPGGKKFCEPSFEAVLGILYMSCKWTSDAEKGYVDVPRENFDFASIVLHLTGSELKQFSFLYAELDTSLGTVLGRLKVVGSTSGSDSNSNSSAEEEDASGSSGSTTNGGGGGLPFLDGNGSGSPSNDADVWNGDVSGYDDGSSGGQGGGGTHEEHHDVCVPSSIYVYPSEIKVSVGEDRTVAVRLLDNCGNDVCLDTFKVKSSPDWISVEKEGCNLKLDIDAPNEPDTAGVEVELKAGNFTTQELSLEIHVVESGGVGTKLEQGKFYYLNLSSHDIKHVYFYACVSEEEPVRFIVEESSYYHYGAVEVIAKFVGDKPPAERDYPTWSDYYVIAKYLFENTEEPRRYWVAKQMRQCPQFYYESWTDWYGAKNPDYSDYFYCMGLSLTRTLWLKLPQKKCGWWAVSLFNNLDEERSNVRVWYR